MSNFRKFTSAFPEGTTETFFDASNYENIPEDYENPSVVDPQNDPAPSLDDQVTVNVSTSNIAAMQEHRRHQNAHISWAEEQASRAEAKVADLDKEVARLRLLLESAEFEAEEEEEEARRFRGKWEKEQERSQVLEKELVDEKKRSQVLEKQLEDWKNRCRLYRKGLQLSQEHSRRVWETLQEEWEDSRGLEQELKAEREHNRVMGGRYSELEGEVAALRAENERLTECNAELVAEGAWSPRSPSLGSDW
ncbi:MAG: hypothetical protein M1831_000630 [Alyxoria varia]|nr:MAG: hypothetical protein M1831_000630 [Alyxoria varia]